MVKLLVGHKGSGKTKQMIDLANESVETSKGSIIFINKNHRLMYDLKYRIRVICMEDFEHVTNSDEYIGFLYGIISSDHDIETIFIDSILKHADFTLGDLPEFVDRLKDQVKDTVHPHLPNFDQLAAAQMLAQQHTKYFQKLRHELRCKSQR